MTRMRYLNLRYPLASRRGPVNVCGTANHLYLPLYASKFRFLQSRLSLGLRTYPFSGVTFEHLQKLKITGSGVLKLKPDAIPHAVETNSIGKDEHWSADGLYRHLCLLKGLVPCADEAAARLWINTIIFRVTSMLPGNSRIIFSVEHNVPPVTKSSTSFNYLSGFVNFTAILTSATRAASLPESHLQNIFKKLTEDHALVISEAKGPNQRLESHIPQAVSEMNAHAKLMRKSIVRGVLTNGHKWIFLILKVKEDCNGGEYLCSKEMSIISLEGISRKVSSLIAAIITHWIPHSYEELRNDDYFMV